jgi:hypothetical protein
MEAVVLVLNVIPAEQQPAALQRLFAPLVQPLHQLLASQPQPQSVDQREAILTLVDRLGVLFRWSSSWMPRAHLHKHGPHDEHPLYATLAAD